MLVNKSDISRRICIVFVSALELNMDPDDPSFPDDLGSVAGLDSLAVLEFVTGLEEEFQFRIEPERFKMEFLSNLKELTDYIAECISRNDVK
jgi:acyl carrier protein